MRSFIYSNRSYLLIILIIVTYLLYSYSAFANDSEGDTSSLPTFGVWVCTIASKLTYWIPSTPSNLWLSNISRRVGDNIPFVGRGIFYTLINDIRNVLVLVAAFKVFKSLSKF